MRLKYLYFWLLWLLVSCSGSAAIIIQNDDGQQGVQKQQEQGSDDEVRDSSLIGPIIRYEEKQSNLEYADGPYILYDKNGEVRIIQIGRDGLLYESYYNFLPDDFVMHVVSHSGKHKFDVQLHAVERSPSTVEASGKQLVLSDPHGDLDCFVSVLRYNGVINERYNWIFGKNQVILIGDIFDRGKDVLPIFWLVYKLEEEARLAGGSFIFLLGNHEEMALRNDLRYTEQMYIDLAKILKMEYPDLWGKNSELGGWLQSKNTIQIVGSHLFVHAGLSADFLNLTPTLEEVNQTVSETLFLSKDEKKSYSLFSEFIYGNQGPLWYRGMVKPAEKFPAISSEDVNKLLEHYDVKKIFVGHTIFNDISLFYDGDVIAVNVNNLKNMEAGRGRGVLIDGSDYFIVYDAKPAKHLE